MTVYHKVSLSRCLLSSLSLSAPFPPTPDSSMLLDIFSTLFLSLPLKRYLLTVSLFRCKVCLRSPLPCLHISTSASPLYPHPSLHLSLCHTCFKCALKQKQGINNLSCLCSSGISVCVSSVHGTAGTWTHFSCSPWESAPGIHWPAGLVGSTTSLDAAGNGKPRFSGRPTCTLVPTQIDVCHVPARWRTSL
jgi:hypothetical protein